MPHNQPQKTHKAKCYTINHRKHTHTQSKMLHNQTQKTHTQSKMLHNQSQKTHTQTHTQRTLSYQTVNTRIKKVTKPKRETKVTRLAAKLANSTHSWSTWQPTSLKCTSRNWETDWHLKRRPVVKNCARDVCAVHKIVLQTTLWVTLSLWKRNWTALCIEREHSRKGVINDESDIW